MKPSSLAAARTSTCHLIAWVTAVGIALAGLFACEPVGADEVGPSDPHVQLELRPDDHESRPAPPPGGPRYDTISGDREFREIERHDRDRRPGRADRRGDDGSFHPPRTFESSSPRMVILLGVAVFALFVHLGIRRRRTEAATPTGAGARATVAVGQPRTIVALACNRCSRVVDVPRDRVARGLFCPRCGSRMPDRA